MKSILRIARNSFFSVIIVLAGGLLAWAQSTPPSAPTHQGTETSTVLVLPFENSSKVPGIEWISEAFPELLGQRLSGGSLYAISREDRLYAFDHAGVPAVIKPSRPTLYRIAEQLDAGFVVLGSYRYDGQTFTAEAQVLDMKQLRLSDPIQTSGALVNLMDVQTELGWRLLNVMRPQPAGARDRFLQANKPVRLDAFENYIRGTLATTRQDKIHRFSEAVRLNPDYFAADLQLGRTYVAAREFDQAAAALSKIPASDSFASEASFLLGISYYYLGQFDKSDTAFKITLSKLPLGEIYNNLGVVATRRNRREASEYFQHAVEADESDSDYRFNLAVALAKNGDIAGARKSVSEALRRQPNDAEAAQYAEVLGTANAAQRAPLTRIKRNYDESSYKLLALEVHNAMEQKLANADPRSRAAYHAEHAGQLLESGRLVDAENEFRDAIVLDPANLEAHLGLAHVAELGANPTLARSEASAALALKPSAEAYLVLARLALKENNLTEASQNADQALWLEPSNAAALELKRKIRESKSR